MHAELSNIDFLDVFLHFWSPARENMERRALHGGHSISPVGGPVFAILLSLFALLDSRAGAEGAR